MQSKELAEPADFPLAGISVLLLLMCLRLAETSSFGDLSSFVKLKSPNGDRNASKELLTWNGCARQVLLKN